MNDRVKFTMNQSGLKDLEKEIKKNLDKELQAFFDKFARSHKGQPVDKVKRSLAQAWKREFGGRLTDPELTNYAKVISEGGKVQVK